MIFNNKNLCIYCFEKLPDNATLCEFCGNSVDNQEIATFNLPVGTILLGKFFIGKVLGKGGFGVTYLAYDLKRDCKVAIKEYMPDTLSYRTPGNTMVSTYLGEKEENFNLGSEKFYEEARTISKFNGHPNVINVYEFFYENNTAYFVMEYVDGVDLKKYIFQRGGSISEEECINLLTSIMDAIIVVHSVGILHRDISPDNIYITRNGDIKLLDFGAARQVLGEKSKSLSVVLKPGFAPIEQYQTRGKQGQWTDVYALAATMYYCLTGQIPEAAMDRIEEDEIKSISEINEKVSNKLDKILQKALSLKAVDRYQTMSEFKHAIFNAGFIVPQKEEIQAVKKEKAPIVKKEKAPKIKKEKAPKLKKEKAPKLKQEKAPKLKQEKAPVVKKEKVPQAKKEETPVEKEKAQVVKKHKEKAIIIFQTLKRKKQIVISIACSILIIAGIIFAVWQISKNDSTEVSQNEGFVQNNDVVSNGTNATQSSSTDTKNSTEVSSDTNSAKNLSDASNSENSTQSSANESDDDKNPTQKSTPAVNSESIPSEKTTSTNSSSSNDTKSSTGSSEGTDTTNEVGITSVKNVEYIYKTNSFSVNAIYTGKWKNNKPNGAGVLVISEDDSNHWRAGDRLTGNFSNGVLIGKGKLTRANGDSYQGNFNGDRQGQGTYIWSDGKKYAGTWNNGKMEGQGTMTWPEGDKYVGHWENGKKDGQGTYSWSNGKKYVGAWKNGVRHGYGCLYNSSGSVINEGQWVNDEFVG